MHRRGFIALLFGAAATLGLEPSRAAGAELIVVANARAPVERLDENQLEAIFTTRRRIWGGGKRIVPFNHRPKTGARIAFDRAVLHMGPGEVSRYWIDRRVRGGRRPPRQIPSSELLLKVVAKLEGAIGYLDARSVPKNVKIVARIRGGKVMPP